MTFITQLQESLHHIAERQYETVRIPPFILYFHPREPLTFFNYGIPNITEIEAIEPALITVRNEFANRNRRARFEFLEEYNPQLGTILSQNGFVEESRQNLMVCNPATYAPNTTETDLVIEELTHSSDVSAAQQFLTIQSCGFGGEETEVASLESAQQFLQMLGQGKAFVGWLAGKPVAVGMVSEPYNSICELAGLATLADYRRQGIATAITREAVARAFEYGTEVVFLTAADERAGRVYQKVGFANCTTVLAYIDNI
jgi:ribosomal protein S18 acetylase RimI-like enzyme